MGFFSLPLLGISFESYFYSFPVSKEWFCLTAWSLSFAVNNCWKVSHCYQVGQIIYPPAVLGCSAECIGTATKRGLLESLESRALLLMGKCVIALSLIPLLLPPMHPLLEGHTLYYTWSLWGSWLFLAPLHLMITLNWRPGKVLQLELLWSPGT